MAHQIDFIDFGSFCKDEIREYYDLNPDLSILTYAGMLGLTGGELKAILMTDGSAIDKEEEKTAQLMFEEADETCTAHRMTLKQISKLNGGLRLPTTRRNYHEI